MLVPVSGWREAVETALRWIALDENQLAAGRRREVESVIAQVMAALDAWLAPYAVGCFEVRHASAANGAGLCGYLVDGTHALVLGHDGAAHDGAAPAMFVLGIGWSD